MERADLDNRSSFSTETRVSRRRALGLAGSAAAAGLVSVVGLDNAEALTNSSFLYNVNDYTGTDTQRISSALSAAGAAGGGIVYVPPGTYTITSSLTVPAGVWLQGTGFVTNELGAPTGSVLLGTNPAAPMVVMGGRGGHVSDLAFYQSQTVSSPVFYEPAILIAANDNLVEHVLLHTVYDGIRVSVANNGIGRILLREIWGQPLRYGIHVNGLTDKIYIHHVHFWPYRGYSVWSQNNGIGIYSQHADNPNYSDLFCYGYLAGCKMAGGGLVTAGNPSGTTLRAKLSNCDFDSCVYGVLMENNATAMLTNVSHSGGGPTPGSVVGSVGLYVRSGSVANVNNFRASFETANGVRVERFVNENPTQCYIDNFVIEAWNYQGPGFAGIENVGSTVIVGRLRVFGYGYNAQATSGCTLDA